MKLFRLIAISLVLLFGLTASEAQSRSALTQTVSVSGTTVPFPNSNGSMHVSFEELIAGSPATVSIVIQGCMTGGTCETLDTYTTVANANRAPSISKVYDSFLVTASWTGGTNVAVTINATLTTANSGNGSGAVASVFGRTGAVAATSGDYTCAQVTGCGAASPTGSIQFNNAGASGGDAALTWDNTNKILNVGTGSAVAGAINLTQGTAPTLPSGAVQLAAPGSVTAYTMLFPSAAATGFLSCALSGSTDTCSFAGASVANYYVSATGTGVGPTSFTPASTCTLCVLDSTASTGLTRLWLGYDAGGSFTTGHISATKTNLSIVSGSTTAGAVQTDDAISFYNAAGSYRGGIITNFSGNVFYIGAGSGLSMVLGASGSGAATVSSYGLFSNAAGKGLGVSLNATSSITGPAVVKADTANANQVVVTTTTDTGAGLAVGVCENSPAAGTPCNIITTGEATAVLGTGTCAIGNFVIVDTTTNGRVKCTGTYTAGTVIGVAMAAQSSVGSLFNVLVGLR